MTVTSTPPAKRENLLLNLLCNIALPTLVLTKLSRDERLGPLWGLIVALAFPATYGIFDFVRRRKTNLISVIGFVGVLLTGGLGLMKADRGWFAVKEASVPLLIGIFVVATVRSKKSLVRQLFFNDQLLNVDRIETSFAERGATRELDKLFATTTWLIGGSMLLSAVLNYALALYFLRSDPGTPAFNAELGRMNAYSYLIIALPSTAVSMFALWRLLVGIEAHTNLTTEQVLREHPASQPLTQVLFSLRGRVGREAFWTVFLSAQAVTILLWDAIDSGGRKKLILMTLLGLAVLVAFFAIQVKRWHDRDRSGAMMLIHLVPGLGTLWALIELGFLPGTPGRNRFGERADLSR